MEVDRRVLFWAFERLSSDCNDEKTNKETAIEIGKHLRGMTTEASKFDPVRYSRTPLPLK